MPAEEWITVARLGKTRGLLGEMFADGSRRLPAKVSLFSRDGALSGELTVAGVQPYKGRLLVRFEEAPTVEEAERLVGCELRIRLKDRPAPPEGEVYVADLVGCSMIDRRTGNALGTVSGWQDAGGVGLLEVSREGADEPMLVPFARSICVEVDPAARRIVVNLPEGLDELK